MCIRARGYIGQDLFHAGLFAGPDVYAQRPGEDIEGSHIDRRIDDADFSQQPLHEGDVYKRQEQVNAAILYHAEAEWSGRDYMLMQKPAKALYDEMCIRDRANTMHSTSRLASSLFFMLLLLFYGLSPSPHKPERPLGP